MPLTAEQVREREKLCKEKALCFISLKPLAGMVKFETHQDANGFLCFIEEYYKA